MVSELLTTRNLFLFLPTLTCSGMFPDPKEREITLQQRKAFLKTYALR